jgi:Arc/MetJ family transcription regulator
MRTNIVLDDELVRKAMALSKVSTKREVVARALEEYVRNHSRLDLRELQGKIKFREGYDYKALRAAKTV